MSFEPQGIRFFDRQRGEMMLATGEDTNGYGGWILWRHPDGQWVTVRKATPEDRAKLAALVIDLDAASEPRVFPRPRTETRE